MKTNRFIDSIVFTALLILLATGFVSGQTPARSLLGNGFTYQGCLSSSDEPYTGACDFKFGLWDDLSSGVNFGNLSLTNVPVNDGYFSVQLDFGNGLFTGEARWLAISVRCPTESGSYTDLVPRQQLTAAPYALALPGLWTQPNATSPNLIGGYNGNWVAAGVVGGSIMGGGNSALPNRITDAYGTISGGLGNQVGDNLGGVEDKPYATVGGGTGNTASGHAATVSGGEDNIASNLQSTVAGGGGNAANGYTAVVSGGMDNTADGDESAVGGGWSNIASGEYSVVPGGAVNLAAGDYSFAMGRRAKAYNPGCFVWGDATNADLACNVNNMWVARASGGVVFFTSPDLSSGVSVPDGGSSWTTPSDRNLKENFESVDTQKILQDLAQIPITSWNYKAQDADIRHIGPMAQDFYQAFGVGEDHLHITTIDADGVALAAIQGLYAENQALKAQVDDLETRLSALEKSELDCDPTREILSFPWIIGIGFTIVGGVWVLDRKRAGTQ
jgi:hypothetical protein